jgi:hypothetical protein
MPIRSLPVALAIVSVLLIVIVPIQSFAVGTPTVVHGDTSSPLGEGTSSASPGDSALLYQNNNIKSNEATPQTDEM